MKKTNIRIKNNFVLEDDNNYYLSSIKNNKEWIDYEEEQLKDIKDEGNRITDQLNELMKLHDIYSNVNFFIELDTNTKTIQVDDKQNGGK